MDHYYGANSGMLNHQLLKISDKSVSRSSYVYSGSRQVVTNREYSWNYPHGTYGMMSYHKTSVCLWTMMGLIGEETTNDIFMEYYNRWAFKHPSGRDFINVVNEVVRKNHGEKFGPDMNWFFDQTIYGTGICDYKVSGISNRKNYSKTYKSDTLDSDIKVKGENDSLYNAVVELERLGEVMLPVEVLVHFKNGDEITESWDGKSRYKDFNYSGKGKVQWVKIDPEYKIIMDVNYINNSMTLNPDWVPVRRLTGKLATLLQFLMTTISL
jgi:aminopeptidase N